MTDRKLRIITWSLCGILCISAWGSFLTCAFATTTWTKQSGEYYLYKVPPTLSNKYELSSKTVPNVWVKQIGSYTQFKSAGGATKYELNSIAASCEGQYRCDTGLAIVYDMSQQFALKCPAVKLVKGQYLDYEAAQSINGNAVCK